MNFLNKSEEAGCIEISSFQSLLIASIVCGIVLFSYFLLLNLWQILIGGGGFLNLRVFNSSADIISAILKFLTYYLSVFLLFTIFIFTELHFRNKTHSLRQISMGAAYWVAIFNFVLGLFCTFIYLNGDGGYGIILGSFLSIILFPIVFLLARFLISLCFRLSRTVLLMIFFLLTGLFVFQFCRVLVIDISSSLKNDDRNHNVGMSLDARWNSDIERCLGSSDRNICLYGYATRNYTIEACGYMYYRQVKLTSREWFLKYSCYDSVLSSLSKSNGKNDIFLCERNPEMFCKDNSFVNLSMHKAIKENNVDICNQLDVNGERCVEVLNDYKSHSGFLNAFTYLFLK